MAVDSLMFNLFSFTTHCVLCNTRHRGSYAVCALCMDELPRLEPTCRTCSQRVPHAAVLRCYACQQNEPAIDHILCAHRFSTPLRHLLHAFKYHEALYLAPCFAALMQQALPIHYNTECLIPIPMHSRQLKQRGFNQTQLLAKSLARRIQRPVKAFYCDKIRQTARQAGLSALARQHNLAHAFVARAMPFQHVTLVDDLITTGATANELARTLKRRGVTRVDLWCCAKAVLE